MPPAGLRRWGRPGSPGCRGRAAGGRGGGGGGPVPCAPLSPRHFGGLLAVVPPCPGLRRPARGRRLGTALPLAAAAGFCPFCTPRSRRRGPAAALPPGPARCLPRGQRFPVSRYRAGCFNLQNGSSPSLSKTAP